MSAGAGNQEQALSARYGDSMNADAAFRVYGLGFHRGAMEVADGSTAHDGWSKGQTGFRSDWSTDRDSVTVQGDFYRGSEHVLDNSDSLLLGGNVLTRYEHHGVLVADDNRDAADSLAMVLEMSLSGVGRPYRRASSADGEADPAACHDPRYRNARYHRYDVAREIRREPWGGDVFACDHGVGSTGRKSVRAPQASITI